MSCSSYAAAEHVLNLANPICESDERRCLLVWQFSLPWSIMSWQWLRDARTVSMSEQPFERLIPSLNRTMVEYSTYVYPFNGSGRSRRHSATGLQPTLNTSYSSPNTSVMVTFVRHAAKQSHWNKHICHVEIVHVFVQTQLQLLSMLHWWNGLHSKSGQVRWGSLESHNAKIDHACLKFRAKPVKLMQLWFSRELISKCNHVSNYTAA